MSCLNRGDKRGRHFNRIGVPPDTMFVRTYISQADSNAAQTQAERAMRKAGPRFGLVTPDVDRLDDLDRFNLAWKCKRWVFLLCYHFG